jgi:hypothetical protein
VKQVPFRPDLEKSGKPAARKAAPTFVLTRNRRSWDFPKIMGESVRIYLPRIPLAHNYKPASQLEKVHQSAWSGGACAPFNDERRPSRSTNLHVAEPGVSVQK